ncbi:hypothetical protein QBC37DRAFT_419058 [Rhypophila decipiens]|uniref:Uncharacterized protein n=1 Tax=Rhypophila decipiens TaxID=261697 RepID=A0AAN6YBE2_9PEZI|nr:hypothetical protein QBC37DRAFT_419058 [Rhypophila decipiens]
MLSNPVVEDGHYTYKLHTRDVPPRVLRRELERLLGSSQWHVEMRHNVYNIQSCTDFDLKDLLSNCQNGSATPRTFSAQNLRERALKASTPRRLPDTPKTHFVTLKSEKVNDSHDVTVTDTDTEGSSNSQDRHTAEPPIQLH